MALQPPSRADTGAGQGATVLAQDSAVQGGVLALASTPRTALNGRHPQKELGSSTQHFPDPSPWPCHHPSLDQTPEAMGWGAPPAWPLFQEAEEGDEDGKARLQPT